MEEMYVNQRLVVLARSGPGYDAKGCHGDSRYARVTRIRVRVYTAAISIEVLRAIFDKAEALRKKQSAVKPVAWPRAM